MPYGLGEAIDEFSLAFGQICTYYGLNDHGRLSGLGSRAWPIDGSGLWIEATIMDGDYRLPASNTVKFLVTADTVAKVENRTTLKISRKLIFRLLCCCLAIQRRYEGPWSILDESIWSLTSPRVKRISGSKKFRSSPQTLSAL